MATFARVDRADGWAAAHRHADPGDPLARGGRTDGSAAAQRYADPGDPLARGGRTDGSAAAQRYADPGAPLARDVRAPTWLLIRHGRTACNARRRLSGQDDEPLDYVGRWQAIRAGLGLRGAQPPPLLLCSDQLRAHQSAGALAQAAGWPGIDSHAWLTHPALRERHLGRWQGRSYDRLRNAGLTQQLVRWRLAPPDGESLCELAARLLGYLAQLPNEPGLMVTHAGPIRVLQGLAQGVPLDDLGVIRVPQAHIIRLELPPGGWAGLARRLTPG